MPARPSFERWQLAHLARSRPDLLAAVEARWRLRHALWLARDLAERFAVALRPLIEAIRDLGRAIASALAKLLPMFAALLPEEA